MNTPYVIETSGLTKRFSERVAVDNVDLHVPRGSASGISDRTEPERRR